MVAIKPPIKEATYFESVHECLNKSTQAKSTIKKELPDRGVLLLSFCSLLHQNNLHENEGASCLSNA